LFSTNQLKEFEIPLPPPSVQEEIDAEIEEYGRQVGNYKIKIVETEQKINDRIAKVWGE
jgi:restriction endonuclease S subunit